MNELLAALIATIVNSDTFKVAVQEAIAEAFTQAKDNGELMTADEEKDIVTEELRGNEENVEKMIESALDDFSPDVDDKVNELIEEYFRDGPKFHISLARRF